MATSIPAFQIICEGDHPTISFAAEELQRCLGRMTGGEASVIPGGFSTDSGIRIGLMSTFPRIQAPQVPDPGIDDAVYVDVKEGKGIIAGINPRSVLLAVYRYLTQLGCRWVRPGADGEFIPTKTNLPAVKLEETASYRHRGICIEGAASCEHVTDIIDWMPKVGFNAYFTQFREAYTFFDRWYSHQNNPHWEGQKITVGEVREFMTRVVQEVKKRDLIYHAVGHGWTCEPFGIGGLGWEKPNVEIPAEVSQYLAQINGKRQLYGGIPLNTNLCYGVPRVREIVANEVANYAEKHPEIDVIHFWLADGSNNNCECELCGGGRPADFYVQMLNSIDQRLTEKGLATKIVFLAYVDLLWPPQKHKIQNPDRFILMFAPITRTYSKSFAVSGTLPELPPFVRNKLEFPKRVEQNVAFLKAWQENFTGDGFDFDYHLMWDHFKDPGYTPISRVISQDTKGLKDIGLNGYMSCQVQRAFFPTGLPMTVMGKTLWRTDFAFEDIAADYFESAFGLDGGLCRQYMAKLSNLFDPVYLRGEKPAVDHEAAQKLNMVAQTVREFEPVIERNGRLSNECWAKSWFYLKHHAEICKLLASALEARARDERNTALQRWEMTKRYVTENEMALHPVLDVFFFIVTLGGLFKS